MVLLGFFGDGFLEQGLQILLATAPSQGALDVYLIISKETRSKSAVCREPQAIAGGTEMATHSSDETNFPFS